jgi:hypothetical protein
MPISHDMSSPQAGWFTQAGHDISASFGIADESGAYSVSIICGTGDPNAVYTAGLGSLFLAADTGKHYNLTATPSTWTVCATA